jgi:hypothetical protein
MKILKVIFLFVIIYHVNTAINGCTNEDGSVCTQCQANYVKNDDGTCQACDVSTKVFEKNHCFTKVEHCANYLYHREGELCSRCESGYTLYLGKCVQTISGCEEYYANGQCKSCFAGYELDDGSCDLVISGCISWDEETLKCKACRSGCFLTTSGTCTCTYGFCKNVDQSGKCTECFHSSLKKEDSGCTKYTHKDHCAQQTGDTCSQCKDDYKISSGNCVPCDDSNNSISCGKILHGCSSTNLVENSGLVECKTCNTEPAGLKKVDPYNQQCTADGNYFIDSTHSVDMTEESTEKIENCLKYVFDTVIKCDQCIPGYQLISGKCYECPEQYESGIGDGKICFLPILNCIEYDNEGNCVNCDESSILENQKCVVIPTKEPARNDSYRINLNIILIMMIFVFLL